MIKQDDRTIIGYSEGGRGEQKCKCRRVKWPFIDTSHF